MTANKPKHLLSLLTKRLFDCVAACLVFAIVSPFFIIISILIKTTTKGPVFYTWPIVGKDKKKIVSYKFRTMVENAEQLEIEFRNNGFNDMGDVYFKLQDDPRITSIGRFLRKFSIDELPSLWSVMKGDMSLVGPRPVRWHEYELLTEDQTYRFHVRPGVTSPWVTMGKNKITDFDDIVKLDNEYIRDRSLINDLKLIMRTIPIVVMGRNY